MKTFENQFHNYRRTSETISKRLEIAQEKNFWAKNADITCSTWDAEVNLKQAILTVTTIHNSFVISIV